VRPSIFIACKDGEDYNQSISRHTRTVSNKLEDMSFKVGGEYVHVSYGGLTHFIGDEGGAFRLLLPYIYEDKEKQYSTDY